MKKDPLGGFNNCNLVWTARETWENNLISERNVGTLSVDETTKEISVMWNEDVPESLRPEVLRLTPIFKFEMSNADANEIKGYTVEYRDNGVGRYDIDVNWDET